MYKIETHLHTAYVSHCGWLGAQALMKLYRACGYQGIVVTDHYNRDTLKYLDIDPLAGRDGVDRILSGYEMMKKEAEKYNFPIRVYQGVELRFDESDNDYLLLGFHRELLEDPDRVMKGGLRAFSKMAREDGALLLQAHPFRKKCRPADPAYLEGVEVLNANPRHDNQNDLALDFGKKHNLIMTAGSDCHRPGDQGRAGILTEELPEDTLALVKMLREGRFQNFSAGQV